VPPLKKSVHPGAPPAMSPLVTPLLTAAQVILKFKGNEVSSSPCVKEIPCVKLFLKTLIFIWSCRFDGITCRPKCWQHFSLFRISLSSSKSLQKVLHTQKIIKRKNFFDHDNYDEQIFCQTISYFRENWFMYKHSIEMK
jgi:hypothetical protein